MDEAVFVDWEFTQQLQRLYLSGDKEEERQFKTCRTSSGSGVNLSIDRSKESAMLFIKYNNIQQFLKDIYTVFKSRLFLLSVAVAFYCEQSLFILFIFFFFIFLNVFCQSSYLQQLENTWREAWCSHRCPDFETVSSIDSLGSTVN